MALTDCLAVALEGGEITKAQHDQLAKRFEAFRSKYAIGSATTAAERAKQSLLDELKATTAEKKRRAKLSIAAVKRVDLDIDGHRNAGGSRDVGEAALFLLEHNGEAKFSSMAGRQDEITGMAHAMLASLLERFRRGKLLGDRGRHNRAQLPNVVREAFGEDSGDVMAKGFAEAWEQTHEWLRRRFNAAGGSVGKLEKWGLPQHHDPIALRDRGLAAWKADIAPLLDLSRMKHPLTQEPVLPDELDAILDSIWSGTVTDGWDTRQPTRQAFGKGPVAGQHAEHRFLVFKDAEAWMTYQADYGGGSDPFAAMMGHINLMARDIAAMETLGPNPQGMLDYLKQVVTKEAALRTAGKPSRFAGNARTADDRARRLTYRMDDVWGSMRGWLSTPVHGAMASALSGIRNFITSSVMGGAALSSISDVGTSVIARRFAGVGGSVTRDYIKALTPAGRRDAVSMGLILDSARHVFAQQARYIGTFDGVGVTGFLADRVLTWSGLTPFTQAGRHAFGLAFGHEAANQAGKAWADLHPLFRGKFEQYGIDAAGWEKIRHAPIHKGETGLTLLRPREIAAIDEGLAEKFLGMIQKETEFAVPSGTHRSRTILLSQNQRGTVPGEVLRSFAQFKSFGAVFAMLHGGRIARTFASGNRTGGAIYAGSLALSSIFFGGLAMQLKQVVAGKDPKPMTTPAFWASSFLQGGGIGLYGDFLFADLNRYGGGLASSIGGPTAERIGDFFNLTLGNAAELIGDGQAKNFGRELVQFARGNVPGGNIWYTRLAWERMVLDQAQWLLDPGAAKSFRTSQQNLARDHGQGFWWKKGELMPARPPNLGNAGRPREAFKAAVDE